MIDAKHILNKVTIEANEFLCRFDLSILIVDNDYFEENRVAEIMFSLQDDFHEFPVAINFDVLYDFLFANGNENNLEEIYVQLKVSVFHEIAHGLISFFDENDYDIPFSYDDEEVCEEFGKFFIKDYSGQNNSLLYDWMMKNIDF